MSDFDDYEDDLRAQNAVEDAKYDFPPQEEPPEGYYDIARAEDDDEEDYGAGHTGELYTPAAQSTTAPATAPGAGGWDGQSWHGFPWPTSSQLPASAPPEHFKGCHPDDDTKAPDAPESYKPQQTEKCWHCGTPTPHGCDCVDCWEGADYVSPSAVYHCPTCGRWWAYMSGINIMTLTFPGTGPEAAPGAESGA